MNFITVDNYEALSRKAAAIIAAEIISKPNCVLGLATGSSPVGTYKNLIDGCKNGDLDFSEVTSVNLDEYVGLAPTHDQSYRYFMNYHLFDHVNIDKANTHVPDGITCDTEGYEQAIKNAGGVDLQLLGIGHDGHIGFNEPCDHFPNATHEVVLEEIDSYRDTPMEAAYDDFEDLLFAGSPMGHNILGNEKELNNITANDCRYYLDTQYVPENMVFFATGNIKSDRLFRIAEKYLGVLNHKLDRAERIVPADVPVFHKTVNIDSHQAHTIVGKKIFSMHDERKYAAFLLNNIIGGPGMNSLLNVAIREKRGYVYTVESSLSLLSDCGLFQIYFGSDNQHVAPSLRIINRTLEDLATKPMSEKALLSAARSG